MTIENGPIGKVATPLAEDVVRLACASRSLLEERPDLRGIGRETLAELTLRQIERDALPPKVLDSFSPRCAYFRGQAAAVTDRNAQQLFGTAEIGYEPLNALPAALAGLSLSPACRALAAEQLLSLTDASAQESLRVATGFEGNVNALCETPPVLLSLFAR